MEVTPKDEEPIFELATECEKRFDEQIKQLKQLKDNGEPGRATALAELRQRFASWAAYLGVFAESGMCLDRRLRHHVAIQDQVLRLLDIMEQNLTYLFGSDEWLNRMEIGPADAPQRHDVSIESLEAISGAIDRLSHLGIAIRQSSVRGQVSKARAYQQTFDFSSFEEVAYLALKTLYADASEGLIQQLTRSMAETYRLFLHRKHRHAKLQAPRERPRTPSGGLPVIAEELGLANDTLAGSPMNVEMPAMPQESRKSATASPRGPPPVRQHRLPVASEKPSSVDSQEVKKKYNEMISPSIGRKAKSILVSNVDYPQPPKGSLECQWCFSPLSADMLKKTKWQQHVNEDHKPYVCISEKCSQQPRFAASSQWFQHMLTSHGRNWHREVHAPSSWVCPLCFGEDIIFSKPAELANHLGAFHDGIFTDPQVQAIVRQSRVRSTRPRDTCPLCCLSMEQKNPATKGKGKAKRGSSSKQPFQEDPGLEGSSKRTKTEEGHSQPDQHGDGDPGTTAAGQYKPSTQAGPSAGPLLEIEAIASHIAGHLRSIMLLTQRMIETDVALEISADNKSVPGGTDDDHESHSMSERDGDDDAKSALEFGSDNITRSEAGGEEEWREGEGEVPAADPGSSIKKIASPFIDGVKVLHDCPDALVDICFVHGLTGDRESTWTAKGHDEPWSKTLLPLYLKARILTYGYDAYLIWKSIASSNRLIDHATNLLHDLAGERAGDTEPRPLIFIAHSLGGLVCKWAMLRSRNNPNPHLRQIFDCTKGIVFMGTPHRGDWMADWARIPASALGVVKSANTRLLELLRTDTETLESLQADFAGMTREQQLGSNPFRVICFFEELPLLGVGKVVSKDSATFEGHDPIIIHANHRDMVRFHSAEDNGFKRLLGVLKRWVGEIEQELSAADQPNLSSDLVRGCLKSLAFPQMHDRSHNVEHATKGTCGWLLRHKKFQEWTACDRGLLCIQGKPGSGKSTLLKHAFNHRAQDSASRKDIIVLSFFFHARGDELQKSPLGLLRSLLHQVLAVAPDAVSDLVEAFDKNNQQRGEAGIKWQWNWNELHNIFEASLLNVLQTRQVWLFVDALDECGEENAVNLVEKFQSLLQSIPSASRQLHICFTCRHYPILHLDGVLRVCPEHENGHDISTYVEYQLSEFSRRTPSTIPQLITNGAQGMFMWARPVVKQVLDLEREGKGLGVIETAIRHTPPALDELYCKLIGGMGPESLKLIQWVCFSVRPLRTDQLPWAMIVDPDGAYKSLDECRRSNDFITEDSLERRINFLGRGLVEIVPSGDSWIIQFIHQSVKDFFLDKGLSALRNSSTPIDTIGMAHDQLSKICLRYLVMDEIVQAGLGARYDDFRFFYYSTDQWGEHARQSSSQEDLLEFFGWPSNALVERFNSSEHYAPETSLVHIACHEGLLRLLGAILQTASQADVNLKNFYGETPLSLAASNEHEGIVQLLLEGGANANLANTDGKTPLWLAAAKGYEGIVQLLLEGGADANLADTEGETPLRIAEERGYQGIVRILTRVTL
ncbi:hypothetical protein RB597_008036 [Gaeumannomyces tritici]